MLLLKYSKYKIKSEGSKIIYQLVQRIRSNFHLWFTLKSQYISIYPFQIGSIFFFCHFLQTDSLFTILQSPKPLSSLILYILDSTNPFEQFLTAFCISVLKFLFFKDVRPKKLFNVYPVFLILLFDLKNFIKNVHLFIHACKVLIFFHCYKTCITLSTDMGHWDFSTLERLAIIDRKNLEVAFKRLSLYPIRDSNVHLSLCMSLGFNLKNGFMDDNLFSFLIWLKNQFWCMVSCMHACVCGGRLLYLV